MQAQRCHLQAVCRSKPPQDSAAALCTSSNRERSVPIVHPTEFMDQAKAVVEVDGIPLEMEVDTGASLSLVSEETYRHH